MKIRPYLSFAALALLCLSCTSVNYSADNGPMTTEVRTTGSFNEIKTDGVFNITLMQGDKEEVKIEANKNIIERNLIIALSGSTLTLSTKGNINMRHGDKIHLIVTTKNLRRLVSDGVGNIATEGTFKTDELDVVNSGVGNMELQLQCSKLFVNTSGVGNVRLSGHAVNVEVKNDGVGNLTAEDLNVEVLHLKNSGVGNTNATASKEAYLDDDGVGNITFTGQAAIRHMQKTGVGRISIN